jgi:cysteine-rich repeat protein
MRTRNLLPWLAALGVCLGFSAADLSARQQVAGAVVGNGIIEPGEACDDGNQLGGDGCGATGEIEQQCYDPGNTFSFFVWSDSYTSAGDGGVEAVFNDALNRTKYPNRVIPRFWVSTGDIPFMVDGDGRLDEINNAISNSAGGQRYPFTCTASNGKYPYFVAIGNHDVDGYIGSTPQKQYNYWSNVVGPKLPVTLVGISNFRQGPENPTSQRTTYSFDYKNAHFVIVNQYQGDPAFPTSDPTACIRTQMHQWIDQDLSSSAKTMKFVFGHEPAWSYCSSVAGYGGEFCPNGDLDNRTPAQRPRPYSTQGPWDEPFGRHWSDSLGDSKCAPASREDFWAMLGRHNVVSHFVGHTHTYSGRLVQADGTRRNDVSPYAKTGQVFDSREGIWEVDVAGTHNSAGAVYTLATVRDNVVTFESFDSIGTEAFKPIETWSVHVGTAPSSNIYTPADGAAFSESSSIPVTVDAHDVDGSISQVSLFSNGVLHSTLTAAPYTFTVATLAAGTYRLTASATDNDNLTTTSAPVTITVNPPSDNHAPVLSSIGDRIVAEQTALTFEATASDLDGDSLTFSLVNAPAGAAMDPTTGIFAWTPTEADGSGAYRFTVRARDSAVPSATADELILVTVNEVNSPPVVTSPSSLVANELAALTFTVSGTDADLPANSLRYSLAGAPVGATVNAITGAFAWTPTESQGPQEHNFSIVATDDGSPVAAAAQPITITVAEVNQTPVLAAISNKTVLQQALLTFTASGTDGDLPANVLTYDLVGAPTGASIDPATGVFSWTPSTSQNGAFGFSVRVTDNGSPAASATRSLTVTVSIPPDLQVSSLSTTTTFVAPGGTLSASNAVINQGGVSAGAFKIAFALSPDPVYGSGDDITIAATRNVTSLNVGSTSSATTTLTVPASTPLGLYHLCAKADSDGAVVEQSETNNSRCTTSQLRVDRPDLTMTAVTPQAETGNAGSTLSVSTTVSNQGGAAAGAFLIGFKLSVNSTYGDSDDIVVTTTRSIGSLAASASSTATTSITIPATVVAGTYHVCALSDSANALVEVNETNNSLCSSVQVTVPPVNLQVSAVSATPAAVAPGSTISTANTVRNAGGVSASSFLVGFRLSADAVYGNADDIALSTTRTVTSLAPAATSTATTTLTVPAGIALGSYFVCAKADSAGAVTESDEADNAKCTAAPVQVGLPDLTVSQIAPGATTANAGATLSVTDSVTNGGPLSAARVYVAYRLSLNSVFGDSDDVSITTRRRTSSTLAAFAASTATTTLSLPSSTPAGTYYVCATADSTSVVTEANEANNWRCSSASVLIVRTNLVLSALTATPSAVLPDGAVSASNSVQNTGGISSGSFVIGFHLSQDSAYGGSDDIALSATRSVTSLAGGATTTATTSLTIPSSVPLGPYFVCAQADTGGTVTESTEADNAVCTTAPLQVGRPDLVASQVALNAATATAGGLLSVTEGVTNGGALAASSSVVAYRLSVNDEYGDSDDTVLATTRTITSLGTSATSTLTTALTVPVAMPAGTYRVCLLADSANAIVEANESNNSACSTTSFEIQPVNLRLTDVSATSSPVLPGEPIVASSAVLNTGGVAAPGSTVAFHLSLDAVFGGLDDVALVESRGVSALAAGATSTGSTTLTVPSSLASGTYFVCAQADSAALISEPDESDNAGCSATGFAVGRPELSIGAVSPGAGVAHAGGTLLVTETATNAGVREATTFTIGYRLSVNAIVGDADDVMVAATRVVVALAAGGSSQATTAVIVPSSLPANSYVVCAVVDAANVVLESDETDNSGCSAATVVVAPPDLAMTVLLPGAQTVLVGAALDVASTVRNVGGVSSGPFAVTFSLSADPVPGGEDDVLLSPIRSVASLAPDTDDSVTTAVLVPELTPGGTYFVCAIGDSEGAVAESVETNNSLCSSAIEVTTP